MKPLVIYHADCVDGYGAAFAAWLKLGDEAEYVPMQYGEVKNVAEMNSVLSSAGIPFGEGEVYILDFSFPKDVMEWLFGEVKRVVWLDHHKTAFEMWCGKYEKGMSYFDVSLPTGINYFWESSRYIHLDDNKSGALLAWQAFHLGTEVPMLIQHIDDRDRWQWKLKGSAEIHAAMGSMQPWSFEQWRVWCNAVVDGNAIVGAPYEPRGYLFEQGTAVLRAQKQQVERMAKQARECCIKWNVHSGGGPAALGLAVNAPLHQSEVGHELANTSGTFGLVWYLGDDNTVRCSLRSNGDYDVSAIARAFGGGGHRNAAGFSTDIETLMGWLK